MSHKYIQVVDLGFVVWPRDDNLYHSHMARAVGGRSRIISAGFVVFENGVARCYGHSESLSMSSLPGDSHELNIQLQAPQQ